jgi:hypothetical protein
MQQTIVMNKSIKLRGLAAILPTRRDHGAIYIKLRGLNVK